MQKKSKNNNLKVVVTNPKTKEEYDKMIDKINQHFKEKYSQNKKD